MFLVFKHLWGWEDSHCCAPPKVSFSLTSTIVSFFSVFVDSPDINTVVIVSFIVFVWVVGNRSVSKSTMIDFTT